MSSLVANIYVRGGVAATWELLREGHTSHQLTAAVRSGAIIRARQGHYVLPTLRAEEIEAIRVGGKLTGASGAARLGIWTSGRDVLNVRVPGHARALRTRRDPTKRIGHDPLPSRIAWTDRVSSSNRTTMSAVECVREVVRSDSPRNAFATAESALATGHLRQREWERLFRSLPPRRRASLKGVGRNSESGGESLLKFDLLAAGIAFAQQVTIPGVGRVDFVVGERLIVEADGAEFHTSRKDFEEDRRRDAELSVRGYRVLRFSYTQIVAASDLVTAAIRAALARGDAVP